MSKIKIVYWDSNNNWGDALNRYLCEKISNKKVVKIDPNISDSSFRYYCIGSRLGSPKCDNYDVWGAGFIKPVKSIDFEPRRIYSIRGKLSRDMYIKNGISCPEIYGDPAMLLKYFYDPIIETKYDIGIIPHYIDQDNQWIKKIKEEKRVTIINILSNTEEFVNRVKECGLILSSTLHGLICADTYNIPGYWIKLSDNVIGNGFKFRDYFSSVNRNNEQCIEVGVNTKLSDILIKLEQYNIDIDLEALFNSCPFKKCD